MYGLIYYKEKFLNDKFENISYYSNVTETNSIVDKYKINKIKKITNLNTTYNLITCNNKLKSDKMDIYEEQKGYKILLEQIIYLLKYQKSNGSAIIRFFDIFTKLTVKLIYILSSCYENVYITKPCYSSELNTDKYLICKNFIYNNTDPKLLHNIKILEMCYAQIDDNMYIYDIFTDISLPNEILNLILYSNIKYTNKLLILLNKVIKYLKETNYFGEFYHESRKIQIENTEWWCKTYFPPSDNIYKKTSTDLHKYSDIIINKYEEEVKKFNSNNENH
jgi:hypothetical protein